MLPLGSKTHERWIHYSSASCIATVRSLSTLSAPAHPPPNSGSSFHRAQLTKPVRLVRLVRSFVSFVRRVSFVRSSRLFVSFVRLVRSFVRSSRSFVSRVSFVRSSRLFVSFRSFVSSRFVLRSTLELVHRSSNTDTRIFERNKVSY